MGRKKGSKNKATIEREEAQERLPLERAQTVQRRGIEPVEVPEPPQEALEAEDAPALGGSVIRRGAEAYKPVNVVPAPSWTMDACYAIGWIREGGHYRTPADKYIKTPDEAAAFYRSLFGVEPPTAPVFSRDMWLIPDISNAVYWAGREPAEPVVIQQTALALKTKIKRGAPVRS